MRRLFAIAALCATACKSQTLTTSSSLATPIGLTVAGTLEKHLFIANAEEDTVQMLNLPPQLSHTTFVRGPARYFPLRIQAGVRPFKLASSGDGRYVIVLDSGTSSLLLIDADALLKAVDVGGSDITFSLSDSGSIPTDMVSSPCPDPVLVKGAQDNGEPTTVPPECTSPHNGRVFVSLAADGLVLALDLLDVQDADGAKIGAEFVPSMAYNVGGQPQHMAVSPNGDYLFITDSLSQTVLRLKIDGGAVDRLDIGGIGGPLAVSRDGDVLLVGRPQWQDVIVIQGPTTPRWSIFDANALHAPEPQCITDCATGFNLDDMPSGTSPGSTCMNQHPADAEICSSGGLLQLRTPYPAINVDAVPTLITTLGAATIANPSNYPLVYSCTDGDRDLNNDGVISDEENNRNSAISIAHNEYALVVTEGDRVSGDIMWLPLRDFVGAPLTPQIANGACGKAALDVDAHFVLNNAALSNFGPYQIGNYMDHCVPVPDRARFSCVEDIGGGGAVVLAGNLPLLSTQGSGPLSRQGRWDFTWEAVIPGLDRSGGGGDLHPDEPVFFDTGLTMQDFLNVQPGDILEIMSLPSNDATCLADLAASGLGSGATELCSLERTITTAPQQSDPTDEVMKGHVYFQYSGTKIPASCFLTGGRVGYRIRAGNQFLVTRNGFQPWRMRLHDIFGPGGTVKGAQHEPAIFRFRPDLPNLFEGPSPSDPSFASTDPNNQPAQNNSACGRYDANGHVADTSKQAEVLSRNVSFAMIITDAFRPYVTGRTYSTTGSTTGSAGSIPGDIYVFQDVTRDVPAKLFVTFAGANTLVGMDPTDASNATAGLINTQIILQN